VIRSIYKRIALCRASPQEYEDENQKVSSSVKFHHKARVQTNITENDRFYFVLGNICENLLNIVVIFDFIQHFFDVH
jgi:hypothetical protein